jgi:hypothetical protein
MKTKIKFKETIVLKHKNRFQRYTAENVIWMLYAGQFESIKQDQWLNEARHRCTNYNDIIKDIFDEDLANKVKNQANAIVIETVIKIFRQKLEKEIYKYQIRSELLNKDLKLERERIERLKTAYKRLLIYHDQIVKTIINLEAKIAQLEQENSKLKQLIYSLVKKQKKMTKASMISMLKEAIDWQHK